MRAVWCDAPVRTQDAAYSPGTQYCVITITNPRVGSPIPDPEALFVPFRGSFSAEATTVAGTGDACLRAPKAPAGDEGHAGAHRELCPVVPCRACMRVCGCCVASPESWQPIKASAAHIRHMWDVWFASRDRAVQSSESFEAAQPPLHAEADGPTPHSTGLGLPLARALAKAGGGWLGACVCMRVPERVGRGGEGEGGVWSRVGFTWACFEAASSTTCTCS